MLATFIQISSEDVSTTIAHAYDLISGLSPLLLLIVGVGVGIFIFWAIVSAIRS